MIGLTNADFALNRVKYVVGRPRANETMPSPAGVLACNPVFCFGEDASANVINLVRGVKTASTQQ
jgi:hypothetical protein